MSRVVTRSGRAGLANVRAELRNGVLTITGTDLERTIVQEIEVEGDEGVALLPKEMVDKILKSLDSSDEITIKESDRRMTISAGAAKWTCNTDNPDEYPEISYPKEGSESYSVPATEFAKMVERTVFAVDQTKRSSGALAGILIECISETLGFTGADGRRLCHQEASLIESESVDFAVIVPTDSLRMVLGIVGTEDVWITLEGNTQIWFQVGKARIASRLMEGMYPKWRSFRPKCDSSFGVVVKPFLKAITQAAIMKNESSNAISFDFSENRVMIYGSQEKGDSSIPCEVGWKDDETTFSFNPDYVIEMLKATESETINIQVGPQGQFVAETEDGFYGVAMGMDK